MSCGPLDPLFVLVPSEPLGEKPTVLNLFFR